MSAEVGDPAEPRIRRTARIIVLDEDGAILLLKTHWGRRTLPARWLTPGGGVDPGEDLHEAAVRELYEETGQRVASLGEPVAFRRIDLPPAEEYQVREATYFVARGPRFPVDSGAWTDSEQDDIVGIRWFTPDELAASSDDFDPEDVRGILAATRGSTVSSIRRATEADASALAAIAGAAYGGYLPRMPEGHRPGPLDADYAGAIARAEVWVIDGEMRPLGFVVLESAEDHLLLKNVAVDPAAQGRGLGRRLLDIAEFRAHELGFAAIRLYTHAVMVENQRLYARRGYVQTHRSDEDGFDRVFFEKRLDVPDVPDVFGA